MKNLHVLHSTKPSKLGFIYESNSYHIFTNGENPHDICDNLAVYKNIYITSEEDIKRGDWCIDKNNVIYKQKTDKIFAEFTGSKKVILTTDQDLIKDGIQAIDDDFLEWLVKNPNCEKVDVKDNYVCSNCNEDRNNPKYQTCHGNYKSHKIFKIIIPKEYPKNPNNQEIMFHKERKEYFYEDLVDGEHKMVWLGKEEPKFVTVNIESATGEDLGKVSYIPLSNLEYVPKQETLEEACDRIFLHQPGDMSKRIAKEKALNLVQWHQERSYSEKEVYKLLNTALWDLSENTGYSQENLDKWFEQFKKK